MINKYIIDKTNEYIIYKYEISEGSLRSNIAYITFLFNYEDKYTTIIYLNSIKQNKGYGSNLLRECINDCLKLGAVLFTLDDMSDRYRSQHNIYTKFGFVYIHEHGPEMELIPVKNDLFVLEHNIHL